ncbi:hypothetical protein ACYATP_02745 [Lactobacillaceae bacterium Melli_B4]
MMIINNSNNSLFIRLITLFLGLLINAIGNGLTVSSNCGSGIWTAAAVNLNYIFGWQLGSVILVFGIFNMLVNQILVGHLDMPRLIGELIYIICFSYLINYFTRFFIQLGVGQFTLIDRIICALIGITIVCLAISLYQRANLFMHPNDDMSNLLRFKLFHGSAVISQFVDMLIPIVIIIICVVFTHRIESVSIGTLYSFLCNGMLIKFFDQHIFPGLIHNFNQTDNINPH